MPFPAAALATVYPSDVHGNEITYYSVVEGFGDLRANHPEVMNRNLATAIAINQGAKNDPVRVQRALADAYAISGTSNTLLATMSDAFGVRLGAQFRAALAAGRLPKVAALLDGTAARAGGITNSTLFEKFAFGNRRPYQVAPERIQKYYRPGQEKDAYPTDPSFPSGHTAAATLRADILAMMIPELTPQFLSRASEVGYDRIVMGVHYPLDVIGGRMVADASADDRWSDLSFRPLILAAGKELRAELEWRCGATLAVCIARDVPYQITAQALATIRDRGTYGLPRVGSPDAPLVVPPQAVDALGPMRPGSSAAQRLALLERTARPAGYPLDDQRPGKPSWQRLDFAAAAVG